MCLFANHSSSNAHIMVLPKLTFVLLFSPLLSPLPRKWRFAETLKTKRNYPLAFFSLWLIDPGGVHCYEQISIFLYSGKKRYFSYSPLSIAMCSRTSIRKYKAYWHMNFSLINRCRTREENIRGHSSFEVALVSSLNIIIVT